jgi:hypothetical protein
LWQYLAEQYGDVTIEPERGADFIRRWWENAVDDYDTPDVVQVTRTTIQDFGGSGMTSAFHDFSIANVAKDFDLSALPANEQARWSYLDSGQGFGQPEYDAAPIFRNQPVSPGDGDAFGGFVAEWGAFTIRFDVDECPNLGRLEVGIDIPGAISNTALMSLLFIREDQVVDVVKKTGTEWNYSRYVPVAPYDRLVAILATLDAPVIYQIAVNCTTNPPSVDFPLIMRPDPTHGGPPGSFAALDVDVDPRGGDPGDGRDDALPAPGWFALVERTGGPHLPTDPRFVPQPFGVLLRVPSAPEYAEVVIERRAHPDFLWTPIARPTAVSLGGAFLDDGLPEGQIYSYRMRGVDAAGNESAVSREITATVKSDPLAPNGALRIDHGPRSDDATVALFVDLYGDDPADIEMRLVTPASRLEVFEPYASKATLAMPTVATPMPVLLTATLRDLAGNESLDYSESILQYPPGSLGSIRGIADRIGAGSNAGIAVSIADRPDEAIAVSASDGSFVLDDLLPGTYRVDFVGDGISGRVTGVVVDPSDQTDVGTVLVPEPDAIAAMLVAIATLARRYGRSP